MRTCDFLIDPEGSVTDANGCNRLATHKATWYPMPDDPQPCFGCRQHTDRDVALARRYGNSVVVERLAVTS